MAYPLFERNSAWLDPMGDSVDSAQLFRLYPQTGSPSRARRPVDDAVPQAATAGPMEQAANLARTTASPSPSGGELMSYRPANRAS
jgi:hypothetical protein